MKGAARGLTLSRPGVFARAPARARRPGSSRRPAKTPLAHLLPPQGPGSRGRPGAPQSGREQHSPGSLRVALRRPPTPSRTPRHGPPPRASPAPQGHEVRGGGRACEAPVRGSQARQGSPGPRSLPTQTAFRNLAWRAVSGAPAAAAGRAHRGIRPTPPPAHAELSIIIIKESPRMRLR